MAPSNENDNRNVNLRRMLAPQSVAIIGASSKQDKAGYQAVKAFEPFEGDVWPVNPQGGEILGRRVYRSIAEIGKSPDLAILAVPAQACVQAFLDVAEAGCGGAIIVSGGFAEAGSDGSELQSELAAIISSHQTRLLGPNTSGFVNPYAQCTASFVPGLEKIAAGKVAVVAQSGGVNLTLTFLLQNRGVGVSLAVGLGNAVDIDASDVIAYLADDPNTRALVVHLEGVGDGRKLYDVIRETARKKPIVALIAGQTDVGAFAQSHTGRMLGSYERKRAMLRQAGAVVVETTDEAADAAAALSTMRIPPHRDPGVVLVTGQAGPGLLIADVLNKGGARLASLGKDTEDKLKDLLPPLTFLGNPVDTGRPGPTFPEVLRTVAADEDVQLIAVFAVHEPSAFDAGAVVAAAGSTPLLFGTAGVSSDVSAVGATLASSGRPCFTAPERLAKAAVALVQDAVGQYRLSQKQVGESAPAATQRLTGVMDEAAAKVLLSRYGVCVPQSRVCETRADVQVFLNETKGRVVLKILAADIAHKTEVGGVIVGIATPAELEKALDKIDAIPARGAKRYLVEEMAPDGVELIVGAVRDQTFGPIVMLGLGGITAEALQDATTRLAPLQPADALAMIEELRGKSLLEGFRGAAPVDKSRIADVLCAISRALVDHPEISEIEINPLRVNADNAVALDALVVI